MTGTETGERDEICRRCEAKPGEPHQPVEGDCTLRHSHTKPGHPPRARIGHCCRSCVEKHERWLGEIVDLYATLGTVIAAGSVDIGATDEYQKPRKAPASPAPFRLGAWALYYNAVNPMIRVEGSDQLEAAYLGEHLPDIAFVLAQWAEAVYDELGYGTGWPTTVAGAAAVLKTNVEVTARISDVDTYDAELAWVRRALRAAHGISDPQPLGHCMTVQNERSCGGLVWPGGGEQPKCDRCGRKYGTLDLVKLRITEERAS